jgi:hypothetical protein
MNTKHLQCTSHDHINYRKQADIWLLLECGTHTADIWLLLQCGTHTADIWLLLQCGTHRLTFDCYLNVVHTRLTFDCYLNIIVCIQCSGDEPHTDIHISTLATSTVLVQARYGFNVPEMSRTLTSTYPPLLQVLLLYNHSMYSVFRRWAAHWHPHIHPCYKYWCGCQCAAHLRNTEDILCLYTNSMRSICGCGCQCAAHFVVFFVHCILMWELFKRSICSIFFVSLLTLWYSIQYL